MKTRKKLSTYDVIFKEEKNQSDRTGQTGVSFLKQKHITKILKSINL